MLVTCHLSLVTVFMYRKPRFLEALHAIREEMSREADYDVDLFAEMVRTGSRPSFGAERNIRGYKSRAPRQSEDDEVKSDATKRKERKRASG